MGGCMSSEATKVENRRTSDPKKPVAAASAAPTSAPPAQPQTAQTDAVAANGPTSGVGADSSAAGAKGSSSATQGLSAALAQAPESTGAGSKTGDKSNSIDRQLEDDSKKFKKECKLLLLGELSSRNGRLTPQDLENRASRLSSSR